jgi:murein DD-endopeptidase MepM/ murein hydrolase activator NlpD
MPADAEISLLYPLTVASSILHSGATLISNHHLASAAQRHAVDFVSERVSNKRYKNEGKDNRDFAIYGSPVVAPCPGKVAVVVHGVPDNIPGEMDRYFVPGNVIIIEAPLLDKPCFIFLAHLVHDSIFVSVGQELEAGDRLAFVGNSGTSSEPHLHMHAQDSASLGRGTGIPIVFENVSVNGVHRRRWRPVRGDVMCTAAGRV